MNKITMKSALLFVLVPVMFFSQLWGAGIATFTDITKPDMMAISDKYIYITDRSSVYVYDLKDFKPIKKFGREGEGPKEFKLNPFAPTLVVAPIGDKLVVNSLGKVSIYTDRGEYIEEFRTPPSQVYMPFENFYIYNGSDTDQEGKLVTTINLADGSFKKIKELYLSDFETGPGVKFHFPINSFSFTALQGKIYVAAGKDGLAIDVFDKSGKKLSRIEKEYKPLKISPDYLEKTVQWFREHPNWKNLFYMFKDRISCRSHYPAIFQVTGDKNSIYVLTYQMKDGNRECIVLDPRGNEKKRVYLPVPEVYGFDLLPRFTFHDGAFYILEENEDEECFDLHKIIID